MNTQDIILLISALGGFEAIKWIANFYMNRKSIRRKSAAEADAASLTNEKNQVDWLESRLAQRDAKIDALYVDLRRVEAERLELVYKNHALELALREATYNECLSRDCQDRRPPRNNKLLNTNRLQDEKEIE